MENNKIDSAYLQYKEGTRVKFKDKVYAVCYNDEINISQLTGTVTQNDYLNPDLVERYNNGSLYNLSIWVEMDKHLEDFDEWNNEIAFNDVDGGTDIEYLTEFSDIMEK